MARNIKTTKGLPAIEIIAPTTAQAQRLIRELCGESGSIECGDIRIEVRPAPGEISRGDAKATT